MRWLFIDTREHGRVRYAWFEDGRVAKRVEREGKASILLPLVAKDIEAGSRIDGVCVAQGPGSFSAVRGGVLDANLLARTLGVPLVPVDAERAADLEGLASAVAAGEVSVSTYVAPLYDREPNITMPKERK